MAYENLASRTGLDSIKSVVTALNQARNTARRLYRPACAGAGKRDQRMNEAEKKSRRPAAEADRAMILFFLPVLFVVIMTPALIQVFQWD